MISTSIAEQPEPRERMVQVVKWYLSAFHAGRKGSVAKKPYNPILGEVFYCHWDLPNETEESVPHTVRLHASSVFFNNAPHLVWAWFIARQMEMESMPLSLLCLIWTSFISLQETVSDGPVPWSSANSVRFVAEQVSHHPPSTCHTNSQTFNIICQLQFWPHFVSYFRM